MISTVIKIAELIAMATKQIDAATLLLKNAVTGKVRIEDIDKEIERLRKLASSANLADMDALISKYNDVK